jgi:hypothetical protein
MRRNEINFSDILYNIFDIIKYPEFYPRKSISQHQIFRIRIEREDKWIMEWSNSEIGQGLAEYAFIIVLVVVVVIVALQILGISIADMYEYIVPELSEAFS